MVKGLELNAADRDIERESPIWKPREEPVDLADPRGSSIYSCSTPGCSVHACRTFPQAMAAVIGVRARAVEQDLPQASDGALGG